MAVLKCGKLNCLSDDIFYDKIYEKWYCRKCGSTIIDSDENWFNDIYENEGEVNDEKQNEAEKDRASLETKSR